MKLKKCNKCHENKDTSQFRKKSTNKDGMEGTCKECMKYKDIDFRLRCKNDPVLIEKIKKWREASKERHPDRHKLYRLRCKTDLHKVKTIREKDTARHANYYSKEYVRLKKLEYRK